MCKIGGNLETANLCKNVAFLNVFSMTTSQNFLSKLTPGPCFPSSFFSLNIHNKETKKY